MSTTLKDRDKTNDNSIEWGSDSHGPYIKLNWSKPPQKRRPPPPPLVLRPPRKKQGTRKEGEGGNWSVETMGGDVVEPVLNPPIHDLTISIDVDMNTCMTHISLVFWIGRQCLSYD